MHIGFDPGNNACVFPAFAQRDFLTADEIEKIREAQVYEPASFRLSPFSHKQTARSVAATGNKGQEGPLARGPAAFLEDYVEILDAIDTVSDDALKRKVDISAGTGSVAEQKRSFWFNCRRSKTASRTISTCI